MVFSKDLRERVRRGRITCSVRIWTRPHVKVGGRYQLGMTGPDGKTHLAVGTYREVKPPTRLAFTWDWDNPAERVGETLVTVEFNDVGDNTTEVVLTHERFVDAARASSHEQGWIQLLRLLDRAMSGKRV